MAKFSSYFKVVTPKPGVTTMTDSQTIGDQGTYANYTWYQRLIQGSASRITRYREYDLMDNDVEVARALDTIAEEMTGNDPNIEQPFTININQEKQEHIPSSTVVTLRAALEYWSEIHDWETRLYKLCRVMIKYGDCFFIRNRETSRWEYLHPKNVVAAIVDEYDMTKVVGWQIRRDTKVPNSPYNAQPVGQYGGFSTELVDTLPADRVIWFSLNDDIGENAPFGESVLRAVYRAHKQKELLEDAIIIYRIQRAPERRVFYVDVGKMPPHRVKAYLEQIKNEIRQRKVPTFGGGVDQVDAAYNPQCLALDTRIPLLDGRELTLADIITEYKQGKKNWIYSVDPVTGQVVPGDISWAGVTRKNTDVVRLTFDNGQQLVCTPDHKIPVQGKGFVQAKDILIGVDALFPFNTREQGLRNDKSKHYKQVYDISKKDWVFIHRMVAEYMQAAGLAENHVFDTRYVETEKPVVHHKDFDKCNNNPDNLVFMNGHDHMLLHSHSFTTNENMIRGRQHLFNLDQNDAVHRQIIGEKHQKKLSRCMEIDPALYVNFVVNQPLTLTAEMFDVVVNTILATPDTSLNALVAELNANTMFMTHYGKPTINHQIGNVVHISKDNTTKFSKHSLQKLIKKFGYKDFCTLRNKLTTQQQVYQNHRVINIEFLSQKIDVGTITVDGKEQLHNYHTYAISAGIFVKNSMNEDFFFAQRPDGRGSKVEVLPGGQGLGELADLEYFQWNVMRGLRIPLSYTKEGGDGALTSDGKVGVAYILELRFALYVARLQRHVEKVLDKEFKRFLRATNISVDPTLFKLRAVPPENFGKYKQQMLDNDLLNTFSFANGVEYLSKRFIMERYLQMSDEEIIENERKLREERGIDPDDDDHAKLPQLYGPQAAPGMDMGGGMVAGTMGSDLGFGGGFDGGPGAVGPAPTAPGGIEVGGAAPAPAGSVAAPAAPTT